MVDFRSQVAEIASELSGGPQTGPIGEKGEEVRAPAGQPEHKDLPAEQNLSNSEDEFLRKGPETGEDAQEDTGEIRDLKGLVEAIDVDPEWLYGLGVPMGDNEEPIPLGKLKDALTQAKRQARDLEQAVNQYKEQASVMPQIGQQIGAWSQEMQQAHGLMTAIEQQYQSTNWDDPNVDKADLIDFKQKLVERYAQAQRIFQDSQAQFGQAQAQVLYLRRNHEGAELLKKIPEWNDEGVQTKERQSIIDTAKQYGYTDQELGQILDHRAVVLLRDLMRLKSQHSASEKTAAQIRKAPKVLGSRGRLPHNNSEKVDALIQQAKTSNRNMKGRAEVTAAKAVLGIL